MNEEKIERICQETMDKLDKQFLNGMISEKEYEYQVNKLDHWADKKYMELEKK